MIDTRLALLVESAQALGVELDTKEAAEWLTAMQDAEQAALQVDAEHGIFGHRVTLLDFDPQELGRLRAIGRIVGIASRPPEVETALALAGSLAQSRIQAHPGDCDFFQRVHLKAATRAGAAQLLADVMQEKAFGFAQGPGYSLIKVQMGSWPETVVRDGKTRKAGYPMAWTLDEVEAGAVVASTPNGEPVEVRWIDAAHDPGWTKLDWVVADPKRGGLVSASNVLDVTWEAPDGTIIPLDGFLDPYFQEVYLDQSALPVFAKLAAHVSDDALADYVDAMDHEARKYLRNPANYGKAAKRMYNLFRYAGQHTEALYLRELFDEPATALYGVAALLDTLDQAMTPGSGVEPGAVAAQADRLVLQVVEALEGEDEAEIVRLLLRLRAAITEGPGSAAWTRNVRAARDRVYVTVNNFFRERLLALPTLQAFIEEAQQAPPH